MVSISVYQEGECGFLAELKWVDVREEFSVQCLKMWLKVAIIQCVRPQFLKQALAPMKIRQKNVYIILNLMYTAQTNHSWTFSRFSTNIDKLSQKMLISWKSCLFKFCSYLYGFNCDQRTKNQTVESWNSSKVLQIKLIHTWNYFKEIALLHLDLSQN